MNSTPFRRGHRKRVSALRLSSDSTVPTLPLYTSPTWQRPIELLDDPSDRPPDYPDSAEEGDADTDTDDDERSDSRTKSTIYVSPNSPLAFSPRRSSHRRLQASRSSGSSRRQPNHPNDPYLDSLLARSVHALELSNTLLQSSMSTQSGLSNVLSPDSAAETSLETQALNLSTRIRGNTGSWMDDLDLISRGVEGLFGDEDVSSEATSQSLPTSGLALRFPSRLRRPSLDFRRGGQATSDSQLQFINHGRTDLIAPPPRALTMYVASTDDRNVIVLPHTLGLRSTSTLPPTPLPSEPSLSHAGFDSEASLAGPSTPEQPKRALDVLSSYLARSTPSPPIHKSRRSSTSSTTVTFNKHRRSKSPPPPILVSSSSKSSSPSYRSRSLTPLRNASPSRLPRPMTPPLEELSASSESSSSGTLHVDRTLESLRNILEKQPPPPPSTASSNTSQTPRPSFLMPPTVAPIASTSTATASISRLFTKGRHSTRPPSPPRQSSLKKASAPPTPTPSPSVSMISVPDIFVTGLGLSSASGHSTPKRISFAELPESYTNSRARSTPSSPRSNSKSKLASKGKGKHKKGGKKGYDSAEESGGWWTSWLLGAAGTGSGSGLSMGASRSNRSTSVYTKQDERLGRGSAWGARPGFGTLDDWAV